MMKFILIRCAMTNKTLLREIDVDVGDKNEGDVNGSGVEKVHINERYVDEGDND